LGALVIAMVAASGALWQPGLAIAAMPGVTVHYTCAAGLSLTVQVVGNMPPGIVVGKPTPAVVVKATATVNAVDTALIRAGGVSSIEGSGDMAAVVVAPDGTHDTTLHLVMSPTHVPTSGQMTFHAAGQLPRLVFHRPGRAVADIGTKLDLTLTLRKANGNPIVKSVGMPCSLNTGQHTEMFSFDITPVPRTR
jgi:hypothetical protein